MILDKTLLQTLTLQAKKSARLRMNFNLHDSLDAKAQRLFNALEPGTNLPIHRHLNSAETYILIRGSICVKFYDEDSNQTDQFQLNLASGNFGVHIPIGQWHTLEVLESGSVIFEVKDGPYAPLTSENIKE